MSAASSIQVQTPADPLSPPRPEAPHFDPALGAWVLSRYADVLAAFREPQTVAGGRA